MGKKQWIVLALILLACAKGSAQVTWQATYGGYSTEEGNSVLVNSDGNYLVVGSTGSFGAGGGDIYVLLLDMYGVKIWSRTLGGIGVDQGRKVVQASDGGYVIAGFTNSFGNDGYDGYVAKLDMNGAVLWEHTYGGDGWNLFYSVSSCIDGGFIVVGQTYSSEVNGDAWVVKLDADGDVQWEHTYGNAEEDFARCVIATPDGGYIFSGATTANGDQDAWLVKLNGDGEIVWDAQIGGDGLDVGYSVIQTVDGGYAIVGSTRSYSANAEILQFKVDAGGEESWLRHYAQGVGMEAYDQVQDDDGRYISVGYVDGLGSGGKDIYILFTDENGEFLSGVTNGGDHGSGDENAWSIATVPSGGFILCGFTESFGHGTRDVYVVKTDSLGLTDSITVTSYFDPLPVTEQATSSGVLIAPTLLSPGDEMHVRLNGQGSAMVRILDLRGTVQAMVPLNASTRSSIRIPDLAPGPYLISIERNGLAPMVARFVVMW